MFHPGRGADPSIAGWMDSFLTPVGLLEAVATGVELRDRKDQLDGERGRERLRSKRESVICMREVGN